MHATFQTLVRRDDRALALAGWWGYTHGGVAGMLQALWIAAVLGVLEVSLSFDNAVVNASVLRHWNEFWRRCS